MIFREFMWLMRNGPSLAEFFRLIRGKEPSITDARAECQFARSQFKEALKRRDAAEEAEERALRATGVVSRGEPWQETVAKMNPTDETTKAYIEAAKTLDKAEDELFQAKREYDRALARL